MSDVGLTTLLGGRGGAVDASVPPLAFAAGWLVAGWAGADGTEAIPWAGGVAVLSGLVVAVWRLRRGDRPRAVLIGLLGVALAVLVALRTGRAVDFFLIQIVSNAASALAWAVSIAIRWPLLGVVVGLLLGQKFRWRRDRDLVRGYGRASLIWTAQYLLRLAVFVPLYAADKVVALGIARAVLTWPLVAACVALSWPAIRTALPDDHPGLRHPVDPATTTETGADAA